MKYCIQSLIFFISITFATAQSTQKELRLISKENIPEKVLVTEFPGDYLQYVLEEKNPDFDGVVLVSQKDLSVSFALIDRFKKIAWQKPVESVSVSMSPGLTRIAIAGKKENKGYFETDVPNPNFGFTLYDANGNAIVSKLQDQRIYQIVFTRSNILIVLSSEGMNAFDSNGKLLWNIREVFQEIQISDGDELIIGNSYKTNPGLVQKTLINPESGIIFKRWQYPPEDNINIACVDRNKMEVIISDFNNKKSKASWDFTVHSLGTFEPISEIKNMEADVFKASFDQKKNAYILVMARSRTSETKNAGEIIFAEWSRSDNIIKEVSLGYPEVNFSTDKTEILILENGYEVTIGKIKYSLSY